MQLVCAIKKYDPKWLDENLPPGKYGNKSMRVDWIKKDEEYSEKVIMAGQEILAIEDSPLRLAKNTIAKYIGDDNIVLEIGKLPNTQKVLDSICESVEDFRILRAKIIIKRLKAEYKNITLSRVLIMINVKKKKASERLIKEIQNELT